MKSRLATTALVVAATVFAHANIASAQQATGFPGNEAVRIVAGKRVVEVPPTYGTQSGKPADYSPPTHVGGKGGPVIMIEGPEGLMACSDYILIKTACIPSDIGSVQRYRVWVVKLKAEWQQCNSRVAPMVCKPLKPTGKIADAMLPTTKTGLE